MTKEMKAFITDLGLNQSQGVVITGRPSTTLNSYAEAQNVDLIVMGTQGKSGMEAVMDSSTRYAIDRALRGGLLERIVDSSRSAVRRVRVQLPR